MIHAGLRYAFCLIPSSSERTAFILVPAAWASNLRTAQLEDFSKNRARVASACNLDVRNLCTVPLVKLYRIIMERKLHYGKKRELEKNPKKIEFLLITCSIAVFSIWTFR